MFKKRTTKPKSIRSTQKLPKDDELIVSNYSVDNNEVEISVHERIEKVRHIQQERKWNPLIVDEQREGYKKRLFHKKPTIEEEVKPPEIKYSPIIPPKISASDTRREESIESIAFQNLPKSLTHAQPLDLEIGGKAPGTTERKKGEFDVSSGMMQHAPEVQLDIMHKLRAVERIEIAKLCMLRMRERQ